ncbi:MAG TPA: aminoacyl-tRNA hydrolase [Candidatus Saccharimonadales bacterium]|nr:aminoacyl-tRNA hydrolase [Candidatus Saccharimonadales bacterium]
MKIIFAQGNPGVQYAHSRHNVGFLTLDVLAHIHSVSFSKKPKFHADIAEVKIADEKVLLVKPTTFYNQTGQAARLLVDFYKLTPDEDVLVIHDDLALPFGTIRTRHKGSDAGNNGIKSLNAHIGQAYTRIRVGVYNDLRDRLPDADFVLGNFTKSETDALKESILPKTIELITAFCVDAIEPTSHKV